MKVYRQSRLFEAFVNEIKYKNRNPVDTKVLDYLKDLSTNTTLKLNPGDVFYRCRIIKEDDKIGEDSKDGFFGFDKDGSFVAPAKYTKDMRANYRYIPYLYISQTPKTAIFEMRPRYNARLSVATIRAKEELIILDFTMTNPTKKMTSAKENLFYSISECFSKPITDEDDTIDYVPTQFIAEYAKKLDYDGICFNSSLFGYQHDDSVKNYVIFNWDKMEAISSNVVKIENVDYDYYQNDGDNTKENMNVEVLRLRSDIQTN